MLRMVDPAWENVVVERSAAALPPSKDAGPGWLQQFELNRPARFLLHYDCARSDPSAADEVANANLYRVGGRVMMTSGIAALSQAEQAAIVAAVAAFDGFTGENDPHGEHDCALLNVGGHEVLWKIDCCDLALRHHSPNPADPAVTTRVLTIMLAHEY
jgi:hypothetical protein